MAVRVYSEKDLPRDRWAGLTDKALLVSPEFISIWRSLKGRGIYFVDEQAGVFISGLAGIEFGKRPFKRFESMPRSLSGGILFSEEANEDKRIESENAIYTRISKSGFVRCVINGDNPVLRNYGFVEKNFATHFIELSNYNPGKKVEEHLRAAARRGGEVLKGVPDDVEALYELAHMSANKHGKDNPYSREFFGELLTLAQTDERIIILKVLFENRPAAFRISFMEREYIFNWQLYVDDRYKNIKPGFLLMQVVIETAKANGIKYINMGSSPTDAESLIKYKESWGGKEEKVPYYIRYNALGKILFRMRGE